MGRAGCQNHIETDSTRKPIKTELDTLNHNVMIVCWSRIIIFFTPLRYLRKFVQ
jgi:hypothetical protein